MPPTKGNSGNCRFLSDFVFPPLPKGLVLAPARVTTQKFPTDNLSVQKARCAQQSPSSPPTFCRQWLAARAPAHRFCNACATLCSTHTRCNCNDRYRYRKRNRIRDRLLYACACAAFLQRLCNVSETHIPVSNVTTDIDIEKDIEKDIDTDKERPLTPAGAESAFLLRRKLQQALL